MKTNPKSPNIFKIISKVISVFLITLSYMKKAKRQPERLERLKRNWARHHLRNLGVKIECSGAISASEPQLLLGNHISYIDILVLMAVAPKISFVAKAEIESWPVVGAACRLVGIIFVKREHKSSRSQTRQAIENELTRGRRIVIFPSGTTSMIETKSWRNGPFEIAKNTNTPVLPFRISYSPLRTAAYINNDFLPTHLFKIFKNPGIQARIEFHAEVKIEAIETDRDRLQSWAQGLVQQEVARNPQAN